MKKRIMTFLLTITIMLSFVACAKDVPEEGKTEIPNTESDMIVCYDDTNATEAKELDIAVTDFAVRLFQTEPNAEVYSSWSGSGGNRLLSPLSVLTAIAMVANGAEGETLAQIEETIGVSVEELNQFLANYMNNLPQEEGNKFHMANSIWYTEDAGFTVKDDFRNINETFYDVDLYESAFTEETVNEINAWVDENTDGLIREIINEIPADAMMYLINALVFDAKWEEIYDESDIREGSFTTSDGIEQDVELMYSEEEYYLEDEHATGFIKYYEGRDYAFVALLPNEDTSLLEYINILSGEQLHNLLTNPEEVQVHAWLPQFEVEYDVELSGVLAEMGMEDAFDRGRADFSGLGTSSHGNIFIDRVIHKTYIEVSPVGTKAGAATAVEIRCESAPMEAELVKEVRLDRPFFYMIINCENRQPIFMGTVNYVEPYRCGIVDDLCSYPTVDGF